MLLDDDLDLTKNLNRTVKNYKKLKNAIKSFVGSRYYAKFSYRYRTWAAKNSKPRAIRFVSDKEELEDVYVEVTQEKIDAAEKTIEIITCRNSIKKDKMIVNNISNLLYNVARDLFDHNSLDVTDYHIDYTYDRY